MAWLLDSSGSCNRVSEEAFRDWRMLWPLLLSIIAAYWVMCPTVPRKLVSHLLLQRWNSNTGQGSKKAHCLLASCRR